MKALDAFKCVNNGSGIKKNNISSGNGLPSDGTKPLPTPILTYYQKVSCGIDLRAAH